MCTKICNYNFTVKDASKLLDDVFNYINLIQIKFIYNHNMHVNYMDTLEELDILFYMIQYISEDNRIIQVTIIWDSRKTNTKNMIKKIKDIEKRNNIENYKVTIIT